MLLAGFDTYRSATLDVIFGCFAPTGKLPLTLPRGDAVLAVNADGVCISPNDVPGYDKDRAICPIPSKTRTAKPMLTAMLREIIMSMDLGWKDKPVGAARQNDVKRLVISNE